VDRLIEANLQLDFWEPPTPRAAVLQRALDNIDGRRGRRADGQNSRAIKLIA